MAEEKKPAPPPAQAGAPDPDEDDLDELDDVLDQFDATKISKESPAASSKQPTAEQPTPKHDATQATADAKSADLPEDADFAKQLEVGMAEMLKELESNPDMAKQFEDMMRQFGPPPGTDMSALAEEAAKSTSAPEPADPKASAPKDAAQGAPEPNFQDTIRRTMERMRASNASASAATAGKPNPSEDDIMSALLQEIANSAPGEGGDDAFSSMLLGMMEQLTNKEILYEPMKELNDKYPAWLEDRKEGGPKADTITAEDRKRYIEQQTHVKEIVERFEKPDYKDSNTEDREYIVERMQKMQAAGAPPQELVGDKNDESADGVGQHEEYVSSSDNGSGYKEKTDQPPRSGSVSVNSKLKNPLAGMSRQELMADVEKFANDKGLDDYLEDLKRGALLARDPKQFEKMKDLPDDEKELLRQEQSNRWKQPWMLYFMTVLCAGSAIVQGMDQSSVNGAQIFYFQQFGITNDWQKGLLNGAPYLCSSLIGCWTTKPLNYYFGRRGCIFISCAISFIAGIWMAVADTWYNLLIARFALGLAVGAKSSTTPVYAAECAPAVIRGALTMMWQMWTAFGIMLGFVVSVAFYYVDSPTIPYLNWRLMLGSTSIPPLIVCLLVYLVPESPRWYMTKNRYDKALTALLRFRPSRIQACRDVYYIHKALEVENEQKEGKNLWKEFFQIARNRRAAQSSFFVMFMQQFCGVNVIAYYSTQIFIDARFSEPNALLVSLGTGIVNWLFAIPAVYTIDTFGRRNLLLTTFPLMGLALLFTGFSFWIPAETARLGCVATGIYLFMVVYSPGEGPVPFTYSAEAFPLYIREYGMSFATATTWFFNFVLSLTWPALVTAFKPQGAFGWYAAWNFVGWVFCYFCLPETKALTLEELDVVFSVRTRDHANYYRGMLPYYFKRTLLWRRDLVRPRPLYDMDVAPVRDDFDYATDQAVSKGRGAAD